MQHKYNIVVTEKYEKNGEEKKSYKTIGRVMAYEDGGFSVKIDTIPVNWNGWANLYEPRDDDAKKN